MSKTALITGASSGIGKELAAHFAKDQYNLVLVARSEQKLHEIAASLTQQYGIEVTVMVKDLVNREAPTEIFNQLADKKVQVDVLVNNAGFGLYGSFTETELNKELHMIDLNIRTLTHLTKLFLPGMVERKQGGILNVASTAAFQPGPLMAVYYATKAYVLSFTEALENELRNTGVTVSALCPGPTKTGFSEVANLGGSKLFKRGVMDANKVSAIGYQGFKDGKTIVIPGGQNKLLAFIIRFFPRKMVANLVRQAQAKA